MADADRIPAGGDSTTETKVCIRCAQSLPRTEFYRHAKMADGLLGRCKTCHKSEATRVRNENLDRCREYDRQRANLPNRVEARREYAASDRGRERQAAGSKAFAERYPEKRAAHIITGNAIANGRLVKSDTCEKCFRNHARIEAHHDDYGKPLEVRWLCHDCHMAHHRKYDREEA